MVSHLTTTSRVAIETRIACSTASDLRVLLWLDHLRKPGQREVDIGSARLGAETELRPERLRRAMDRQERVMCGPRGGDLTPVYEGHRIDWENNPWVHVRFTAAWCEAADGERSVTVPHAEYAAMDTRCGMLLRVRAAGHLAVAKGGLARVRYGADELGMLTGERETLHTHLSVGQGLIPADRDMQRHAPSIRQRLDLVTHAQHDGDDSAGHRADWLRHVSVRWRQVGSMSRGIRTPRGLAQAKAA